MIEYNGMKFLTCDKVYEPAEDTYLLADNLKIKRTDSVLEIGTGIGIIAVKASKLAYEVVAIDINPYAVECARKNAEINAISLDVKQGDLFEPVADRKFDLILFNTPYLPSDEDDLVDDELDAAWNGGSSGREVIDRFIDELPKHMSTNATVQLVQSSLSNIDKTISRLENIGMDASVTSSNKFFFEEIVVITAFLP